MSLANQRSPGPRSGGAAVCAGIETPGRYNLRPRRGSKQAAASEVSYAAHGDAFPDAGLLETAKSAYGDAVAGSAGDRSMLDGIESPSSSSGPVFASLEASAESLEAPRHDSEEGQSKEDKGLRKVSLDELAKHSSAEDAWISFSGKVYNVTSWLTDHPGGQLPLLGVVGGDATDVFLAMHGPHVLKLLPRFLVGELVPSTSDAAHGKAAPRGLTPEERSLITDYRDMSRWAKASGLMRPDPMYYVRRGLVLSFALSLIVWGVVGTSSTIVHMLCALGLGLWWNQVNFIGHDAGHNSITGNSKMDSAIGFFVGNALTGISIGWWKRSHNVHHVMCNSVTHDPDVQHVPVFAVSNNFFKSHYSFYHFRQMTFDALARFFVAHQHITFYPIMAIARLNLYIQSLLLFFSSKRLDHRPLEAATMVVFWVWYSALLAQLPNVWERLAFFLLSHAVTGILHVQICISHFANPTYEGRNDAALWARTQLLGSLDVTCPPYMDWFHGGLQFQIEHHLFPRVPRRNLRQIAPVVQEFCKKHDLPYTAATFWGANVLTVQCLRTAAMEARAMQKNAGATDSFFQSLLWDAMNAKG